MSALSRLSPRATARAERVSVGPRGRTKDLAVFDNTEMGLDLDEALPDLDRLTAKGGKGKPADPKALEHLKLFRETMTRLREQASGEVDDYRSDASMGVMLRSMLATTIEMIPTAAEKYLTEKNESAAYAYNALVNQAKDLQTAIRGLDSLEEQADHIVNQIMLPTNINLMQTMISGLQLTKSTVDNYGLRPADAQKLKTDLDNMVRGFVHFMEEQSRATNLRIKEYLIGDTKAAPPPKRLSKR